MASETPSGSDSGDGVSNDAPAAPVPLPTAAPVVAGAVRELLADLDRDMQSTSLRVREWYGWHFPELAALVTDNVQYAKVVAKAGLRDAYAKLAFANELAPELEKVVKEAAADSMGTDLEEADVANVQAVARRVIELHDYRVQLLAYLDAAQEGDDDGEGPEEAEPEEVVVAVDGGGGDDGASVEGAGSGAGSGARPADNTDRTVATLHSDTVATPDADTDAAAVAAGGGVAGAPAATALGAVEGAGGGDSSGPVAGSSTGEGAAAGAGGGRTSRRARRPLATAANYAAYLAEVDSDSSSDEGTDAAGKDADALARLDLGEYVHVSFNDELDEQGGADTSVRDDFKRLPDKVRDAFLAHGLARATQVSLSVGQAFALTAMTPLREALPSIASLCTLSSLSLSECTLSSDANGVTALLEGLSSCPALQAFSIDCGIYNGTEGSHSGESADAALGRILAGTALLPRMHTLEATGAGNDAVAAVSASLTSTDPPCHVQHLYLTRGRFGIAGFKSLGEALVTNTSLVKLALGGNDRGTSVEAARALAVGLAVNKTLVRLDVRVRELMALGIRPAGVLAIVEALESNAESALGDLVCYADEFEDVPGLVKERLHAALARNAASVPPGTAAIPPEERRDDGEDLY